MIKSETRIVCEDCGIFIEPAKGKIVQGNIYMVDGDSRGGLLGGGNPEYMATPLKDIEMFAYCDGCFLKCLHITSIPKNGENRDGPRY